MIWFDLIWFELNWIELNWIDSIRFLFKSLYCFLFLIFIYCGPYLTTARKQQLSVCNALIAAFVIPTPSKRWVIKWSIGKSPSRVACTNLGTSRRLLNPPNAVPFQTLPVTSWNGRVEISCPAAATPITHDSPQPDEIFMTI